MRDLFTIYQCAPAVTAFNSSVWPIKPNNLVVIRFERLNGCTQTYLFDPHSIQIWFYTMQQNHFELYNLWKMIWTRKKEGERERARTRYTNLANDRLNYTRTSPINVLNVWWKARCFLTTISGTIGENNVQWPWPSTHYLWDSAKFTHICHSRTQRAREIERKRNYNRWWNIKINDWKWLQRRQRSRINWKATKTTGTCSCVRLFFVVSFPHLHSIPFYRIGQNDNCTIDVILAIWYFDHIPFYATIFFFLFQKARHRHIRKNIDSIMTISSNPLRLKFSFCPFIHGVFFFLLSLVFVFVVVSFFRYLFQTFIFHDRFLLCKFFSFYLPILGIWFENVVGVCILYFVFFFFEDRCKKNDFALL